MSTTPSVVQEALALLDQQYAAGHKIASPADAADWLRLKYHAEPSEVFGLVYLTNRHQIIRSEILFRGSVSGCSVPLREVARSVLKANAAAVIVFHNHPSGDPTPSTDDRKITQRLGELMDLIDVRLLDHLVVGRGGASSFKELLLL